MCVWGGGGGGGGGGRACVSACLSVSHTHFSLPVSLIISLQHELNRQNARLKRNSDELEQARQSAFNDGKARSEGRSRKCWYRWAD